MIREVSQGRLNEPGHDTGQLRCGCRVADATIAGLAGWSMASRINAIRASALLLLVASAAAAAGPPNRAKSSPEVEVEYHSMVPLGMETFAVRPWHSTLT